jgi:hypothetical protein
VEELDRSGRQAGAGATVYDELKAMLMDVFERELKPRLETIPTPEQKAKASAREPRRGPSRP